MIKKKIPLASEQVEEDNNRSNLLFNPSRLRAENILAGNWGWARPPIRPPAGTKPYWKKPVPEGAGSVDWYLEGNQWLRGPDFRKMYVENYRNAYSTELAQATRRELVPGFWHERITKGRVLTHQDDKANGSYNENGVNLYLTYGQR